MSARRIALAMALAGAVVGVGVLPASTVDAASCWSSDGTTPGLGTSSGLDGVAVLSSCSAWAAGTYNNGSVNLPLIERWNGTQWTASAGPTPSDLAGGVSVWGVAAPTARSVWAVGYYDNGTTSRTFVEHYDGSNWSVSPSRNPFGAAMAHGFVSVAGTSATDVWAVGWGEKSVSETVPLIEHWDGSGWTVMHPPVPTNLATNPDTELEGVTAISATNVWAVGYYDSPSTRKAYVVHWDGAHWHIVPSIGTTATTSHYELNSVDATSGSNVFAAGYYDRGTDMYPLMLHWNGTKWVKQSAPQPGSSATFFGVTTLGPKSAWAVGQHGATTLVERWNGTKWSVERTPNVGTYSALYGVDAVSATTMWAVGSSSNGSGPSALALQPS